MSEPESLGCHKCGKPIGYVKVTTKSFLSAKSSLVNVKLVANCIDGSTANSFYCRNL